MSKYKTMLMPLVILQQYQNLFWSKANRLNNCWNWRPAPASGKYGLFAIVHNKIRYHIRAHRAAWMLQHHCQIPPKLLICHHCDNPVCVNPDHLFSGTNADNPSDMSQKEDHPRGEKEY
ncbi:MAG: hypothetical protein DRJ03_00730 [Chloroflexi bacterium]|nr:MAG: hypothetical protein DRJ03_00730 [Chloroflexota bacterium]